ncbi:MAG: hypothetical protein MHM6MM_008111, partial [Cercozoa sp. M6MM]
MSERMVESDAESVSGDKHALLSALLRDEDDAADRLEQQLKTTAVQVTSRDTQFDGLCVECTDQPAAVFCEACADDFCDVCFASLHRRGNRRRHTTRPVANDTKE